VLYYFPSRIFISEFSKSKIQNIIDENDLAGWFTETDSSSIKKIGTSSLFLRGMGSRTGLKAVTGNLLIFDEVEEITDQSLIALAMERLSHVENPTIRRLSVPSLPGWGINSFFLRTDQRFWLLKCQSCNEYTCLEDFAHNLEACLHDLGDRVIRACPKCGAELDIARGEWVAKCPGVKDFRGYHVSQLYSRFVNPRSLLETYRIGKNMTSFFCDKLGIPFTEAENQITVPEVMALCGEHGILDSDPGIGFLGCDQGADLHATIISHNPGATARITYLAILKDWEQLDRLMKNFNVSRAVVDGLPDQRGARAFAERFRGRVFLSFYRDNMKGKYRWSEKDLTVASDRTESLDASGNVIYKKAIILPRESEIIRTFAQHMSGTAKKLIEDSQTGSQRYVYIKLAPDHFRHSFSYAVMSWQYGAGSFFGQSDLG
jgi:hypothetical protein